MSVAPKIGRAPVRGEGTNPRAPLYRWDGNPARPPKAGEYYLSGAEPVAYRAPCTLSTPYFIAVPVTGDIVPTPREMRSDASTIAAMLAATPEPFPAHRTRLVATRARQLADDAEALARHLALTEES